jgi:hypothetical protein
MLGRQRGALLSRSRLPEISITLATQMRDTAVERRSRR